MNGRKISRIEPLLLSAFLALVLLAGCAAQQRSQAEAGVRTEQVCVGDVEKAAAMQAAEEVLAGMHFTIEKADAETGLIRTRPLSGAQFFEFWRKDSVGGHNKAEANLHTIRRTVELNISKDGEATCIGCNARTQRLNLPEYEGSSSARAYAMFSESSASLQRMRLRSDQRTGVAWVDLGRDARLEAEVLERIEKRISEIERED